MLPRLRAVASQCRSCIEGWPRLQALVSQWWEALLGEGVGLRVFGHAHDLFGPSPCRWEQPAQWVLATPPGSVPFSHWLERWSRATRSHEPSGLESKPRP